jgi:hypothetical protein
MEHPYDRVWNRNVDELGLATRIVEIFWIMDGVLGLHFIEQE